MTASSPMVVVGEHGGDALDEAVGQMIGDVIAETGMTQIMITVTVIETLARDCACDAPDETAAFLRAFADLIEADHADTDFDAADAIRVAANVALQTALTAARPDEGAPAPKAVLQ